MLAFLLAVSVGCGGTPMAQQLAPLRTRRVLNPIDTLGPTVTVKPPASDVWRSLHTALVDLGLEINFREEKPMRLGTCYQRVRGRLGKQPLSSYLECGEVQSMPNADQYEVAVTVLATVQPNADGTSSLSTFVLGVARDDRGGGNRLWCQSTGRLEEEIRNRVEK